jgi:Xaa-Pro dipeptidase
MSCARMRGGGTLMQFRKCLVFAVLAVLAAGLGMPSAGQSLAEQMPHLLPWSQQIAVREGWLQKRHAMLLDMMRRHNVDMWIVVNEEFHDDPMTEYVAPPRPYTGNRDFFVFIDAGEKSLKKIAITAYTQESVSWFFENDNDTQTGIEKPLRALWDTYHPAHIALGIDGKRGVTRSLTKSSYEYLASAMGPEAVQHFVPAEDLITEYLETRLPEEFETYKQMVIMTDLLTKRGLSNEVITPGKTTIGDVVAWFYDQMWENRVNTWFAPHLRIQRAGAPLQRVRGRLPDAKATDVFEPGDVIHIDFGITYMGLNTDWQKMAYVLKPGETDAPAGLKQAMKNMNAVQDALAFHAARPGRTGAEVYKLAMDEMVQDGIDAMIYSHPIGNEGHGLGAWMDARVAQAPKDAAKGPVDTNLSTVQKLRKGSYLSVELNAQTAVPEWGGQKVYVMGEDDAYLTDDGYKFFLPRQTEFYLISSK